MAHLKLTKISIILFMQCASMRSLVGAFQKPITLQSTEGIVQRNLMKLMSSSASSSASTSGTTEEEEEFIPPWNEPSVEEKFKNGHRSRQHVNPLSRRFQMQTRLPEDWPRNIFDDMSRPLFIDVGCSRGGFLVDAAGKHPRDYNYLGLEIRPVVAMQAQARVAKHDLTGFLGFVGCNVNVDLGRLLTLAEAKDNLKMVAIQFPDPHFKSNHLKRRVVTPKLVTALAEFMPKDATIFLQSDVQLVLDEMRQEFRLQSDLFRDELESTTEYHPENLIGVPTEREVSVMNRGLPIYRAVLKRTEIPVKPLEAEGDDEEEENED